MVLGAVFHPTGQRRFSVSRGGSPPSFLVEHHVPRCGYQGPLQAAGAGPEHREAVLCSTPHLTHRERSHPGLPRGSMPWCCRVQHPHSEPWISGSDGAFDPLL